MRLTIGALVFLASFNDTLVTAAEFAWTGMRNPCKQSAEDGLDSSQLGKKIGVFVALADQRAWAHAIFNVHNRFPQSKPWVTWSVGAVRDAEPLSDAQHDEYLAHLESLGVQVFLELAPHRDADVPALIDEWLAKLKHYACVKGLGVDLEYFKPIDDATAQAWDEQIKRVNPDYRLFFKHWEERYMPPTYRGRGDLIFINTSSEATPDALNDEFAQWTKRFAPFAVAFQIGYPSDEDGMDGDNAKGWWTYDDPIRDWGHALLAKIGETDQEIGLLWVCVKSGKSYNAGWDLTHGAELPAAPR